MTGGGPMMQPLRVTVVLTVVPVTIVVASTSVQCTKVVKIAVIVSCSVGTLGTKTAGGQTGCAKMTQVTIE